MAIDKLETVKRRCKDCGNAFIITPNDQLFYKKKGYALPKRCKDCRRNRRTSSSRTVTHHESTLGTVPSVCTAKGINYCSDPMRELAPAGKQLFIIGNGFDLAHGTRSSYWDFEHSLGKNSELKSALEQAMSKPDFWGDFEENLAHINDSMMISQIDEAMNILDVYDDDAQVADLLLAADFCVQPLQVIQERLPESFAKWVNTLHPGEPIDVLTKLFDPSARYLTFNYTEFLTSTYGIPESRITYIHGKRNLSGKSELILGHSPDANANDSYNPKLPHYRDLMKAEKLEAAEANANTWINWYQEAFTKKTSDIIKLHKGFFESLADISSVTVIGHSLSYVDMPYFREIVRQTGGPGKLSWTFSAHSPKTVIAISQFLESTGIPSGNANVFCL